LRPRREPEWLFGFRRRCTLTLEAFSTWLSLVPTIGLQPRRVDNRMGNTSLWELFEHGGPVMWPLLAASILGLAVIGEGAVVFAWWYQGLGRVLTTLRPLISERAWPHAEQWCRRRGPFTHLARVYLQQRDQPKEIREDVLRREGSLVLGNLEQRLRWLAV